MFPSLFGSFGICLHTPHALGQGRHKKESYYKRHKQIYNHHYHKILEITLYLVIQQKNHYECTGRGERGGEYRREGPTVTPAHIVITHHNRIVYHEVERYGDAGK